MAYYHEMLQASASRTVGTAFRATNAEAAPDRPIDRRRQRRSGGERQSRSLFGTLTVSAHRGDCSFQFRDSSLALGWRVLTLVRPMVNARTVLAFVRPDRPLEQIPHGHRMLALALLRLARFFSLSIASQMASASALHPSRSATARIVMASAFLIFMLHAPLIVIVTVAPAF
jgi:hypothetical protein